MRERQEFLDRYFVFATDTWEPPTDYSRANGLVEEIRQAQAVGAALGRPRSSRALALLGDVTFLHDSNGLVIGPGEERPDLMVVVVNDDGGSIFSVLEQGGPSYASSFEKLFGTPHGVDLAALCAASGTPHRRVTTRADLERAIATPRGGVEVVEAVVRRDDRRELDAAIRSLT